MSPAGHTLVVRLDNDGDVLLAGPAIRAVAAGSDGVTLLCGPHGRQAAAVLPGVDEVIVHRAPWIDPEPDPVDRDRELALAERLAGIGIERAIVMTSFHQSPLPAALLLRFAGIGTIAATSVDYAGSLLDVRHRIDDEVHEVIRSLSLVATLGFSHPDGADDSLRIERRPGRRPAAPTRPYVVVHPGASVPARAWAPERHAELVEALQAHGLGVVVTGSAGEVELTKRVAGPRRAGVVDAGGGTDFAGLAETIAGAAAIVVGNTGPAHLAAAVSTPVVSLFAPTVPPVRWRPWRVPYELLHVDVPCAGCRARDCPVPGHPCMTGVSVDEAVAATLRLVEAHGNVPRGGPHRGQRARGSALRAVA